MKQAIFITIFGVLIWLSASGAARAASSLAIVKSDINESSYGEQHLGNYDEAWQAFEHTLLLASVRYDTLVDSDLTSGSTRLKDYKVIVLPLLIDLSPAAVISLTEYTKNGGKLLITDSGGMPSQAVQPIYALAGALVSDHFTTTDNVKLVWKRDPFPIIEDFSIGTVAAKLLPSSGAESVAQWTDANNAELGPAIVRSNTGAFISWAPGLQGEISINASLLSLAMDSLVPGISQEAAVQISFAEYQSITQDLNYLTKRTEEAITTAKQADLTVPFKTIKRNYEAGLADVKSFQEAYQARSFYAADQALQRARQEFAMAYAEAMPVRPVEARSVWLDRGTIIASRNAVGLSALFDKLKQAGVNTVYFETNNAGFCTFPTKVSIQNPNTVGWDPLGVAVQEAHKRGMELHAWMWVFAVGNMKHNPILGKDADYPGPVLSNHDFSWALESGNGSLVPKGQSEFWIDPANPQGCQFIKNLILEVVQNYQVDGIQYDYIRYPFNNRGGEMGFNWAGRLRFEQETGLSLDDLNENTRQVWQAWKIQQVTNFVKDVSTTVRQLKPNSRISAAVYALPKRWRLGAIQQEWETWVSNGWVDTLNPMTYVTSAPELANVAGYVRGESADKALVYPGLSIRQLDTAGLIEQLDTARAIGTLGTTMFAVAQLDEKKQSVLKVGPYRKQSLLTPQTEPVRASRFLFNDFASMVNRYLQDPKKQILSDQSSTNEVLLQMMSILKQMQSLSENSSYDDLVQIKNEITSLHENVKEWLRLEAFIQRGYRAQYIANYLSQVEAILSYAAQRAQIHSQVLVGTSS